ncbi:hypothetical protein Bbelb_135410 [Branchiostoma belcheri]|nr:hypothetical protein Bbelb_135410 [Branchiostoma belcheri]
MAAHKNRSTGRRTRARQGVSLNTSTSKTPSSDKQETTTPMVNNTSSTTTKSRSDKILSSLKLTGTSDSLFTGHAQVNLPKGGVFARIRSVDRAVPVQLTSFYRAYRSSKQIHRERLCNAPLLVQDAQKECAASLLFHQVQEYGFPEVVRISDY